MMTGWAPLWMTWSLTEEYADGQTDESSISRTGCRARAQALNEQGYLRKDGGDWTGDDVRSLLRSPTYCGYYYNKNVGGRRAGFIKEAIVEADLFIKLAGLYAGNKHIRVWYDDLARLIEELR